MPVGLAKPFFLGTGAQRRFAVLFSPPSHAPARGALLFVPAFAEEMNKSRRMVAACARALTEHGWTVLLFDLLGTGDSPGKFADANWDAWLADLVVAHDWLRIHTNETPALLAMRAGGLLATAALPRLGAVPLMMLWQPVLSGKSQLTQFLRLKVAAESIAGSDGRTTTRSLVEQLARGERVEVAGYELSPDLALPLNQAELATPLGVGRVVWIDVSTSPELSPAAAAIVLKWRDAGVDITTAAVVGVPFWQTQEIEDCPALIEATLRHSRRDHERR